MAVTAILGDRLTRFETEPGAISRLVRRRDQAVVKVNSIP